jgi:hypothetical protein
MPGPVEHLLIERFKRFSTAASKRRRTPPVATPAFDYRTGRSLRPRAVANAARKAATASWMARERRVFKSQSMVKSPYAAASCTWA